MELKRLNRTEAHYIYALLIVPYGIETFLAVMWWLLG